jgi:hypothetical protein
LKGLEFKIISPDKQEITIDELVDGYYSNAEDYFCRPPDSTIISTNISQKADSENVYLQNGGNRVGSQENPDNNTNSITPEMKPSEKLGMNDNIPNYLILRKCPLQGFTFANINQETVDHHYRFTHGAG